MNLPSLSNRQIILDSYPEGLPAAKNFRMDLQPVPDLQAEQVLVRTHYLSMDPFPRLRMQAHPRMGLPLPLGSVMIGRGVGKVIATRSAQIPVGGFVSGELGWQEFAVCDSQSVRTVDPAMGSISASLGILGPSGIAAFIALRDCGQPRAGSTVVVTAAAGAVGSVAGQLARLQGCRAVGICLGPQQAAYLTNELGFDAAIDSTDTSDLRASIARVCPTGVDVLLDSVGGDTHNAIIMNMNPRGKVVVLGFISAYNLPAGGEPEYGRMYEVIRRRLHLQGFLVGDHAARFPAALAELSAHVRYGQLKLREHITRGLENTPQAFAALFSNTTPGKQLVQIVSESSVTGETTDERPE